MGGGECEKKAGRKYKKERIKTNNNKITIQTERRKKKQ